MTETHTWPDLAVALYDKLTGRGAEITYHFDNLEVHVPAGTGAYTIIADWKVHGALRISTQGHQG